MRPHAAWPRTCSSPSGMSARRKRIMTQRASSCSGWYACYSTLLVMHVARRHPQSSTSTHVVLTRFVCVLMSPVACECLAGGTCHRKTWLALTHPQSAARPLVARSASIRQRHPVCTGPLAGRQLRHGRMPAHHSVAHGSVRVGHGVGASLRAPVPCNVGHHSGVRSHSSGACGA